MTSDKTKELSLRDTQLLTAAANGWTGEKMETEFGIPAAQAIMRVKELLQSLDVFDMLERKKLVLVTAYQLKEKLENEYLTYDEENPKVVEAYLKVIRTISDLLERQGRISEAELELAAKAQSKEIVRIVSEGYGKAKDYLLEHYSGLVDLDELDEHFEMGMREASHDG